MPLCLCATGGGIERRVETTMQEVSDKANNKQSDKAAVTVAFMAVMFMTRRVGVF